VGRFLEFLIVRSFLAGLQCFSYEWAVWIAKLCARIAYRLSTIPRLRALANLDLVYPEIGDGERRDEVVMGVFEMLGHHAAEVAHISRQRDKNLIIENGHLVQEAFALGRGVVAVSAHMGPFVRMALVPQKLGVRVAAVMKKQQNMMILDWARERVKLQFEIHTFLKHDARDTIGELLGQGYLVGLFADQHPRKGGFECSFFGKPVMAAAGPAIFAKRHGAPLLFVSSVTRPDGKIVLRWEGPIPTDGTHQEISQQWMSLLEARIREYPDQWTWMHRRWRHGDVPDIREVARQQLATQRQLDAARS
jgi:KDO2-lipid IV(A) lauroyltransferase